MSNCNICDYKITIINKVIKCPYCSFESCEKCCNKYLLLNSQPQCMNCRKVWNDDFIYSELSPKFLNKEYRTHMTGVIYDQEKSMLPETMVVLNNLKKAEKLKAKIIKLREKILKYEEKIEELSNNKNNKEEIKKINIIKECPNEDCKGFLNNKLICGLCNTHLCSKCEKVKDEEEDDEHICNDDDMKTVKMKKSECKNCPNCSKITYKDGGCDQVWCPPPCNNGIGTAWRFSTGTIDIDRPHAPLYYEYQRRMNNGVIPPVDQCMNVNELPFIWDLEVKLMRCDISRQDKDKIFSIHRNLSHNKYIILPKYQTEQRDNFEKNLDLRIKYLKDDIDEDRLKKTLILRHKASKKKQAIYDNIHMFINVSIDIFNTFMNSKSNKNDINDMLNAFDNIRNYYNQNITSTLQRYNSKCTVITYLDETFAFVNKINKI